MISTKEAYNLVARLLEKKDKSPENAGKRLNQTLLTSAIKTLGSILIVLKLGGVITVSWFVVFLPLIIVVGLTLLLFPLLILSTKLNPDAIKEKLEN